MILDVKVQRSHGEEKYKSMFENRHKDQGC